jgi:hypothetical protein
MLQIGFVNQLLRRAAPYRAAALEDVMPVGNAGEIFDILVEHQNRLSVAEIIALYGQEGFRRMEQAALGNCWREKN